MNTPVSTSQCAMSTAKFACMVACIAGLLILFASVNLSSQSPFQVALHKTSDSELLLCVENPESRNITVEIRGGAGELLARRKPGNAASFVYRCSSPDSSLFSSTIVLIDKKGVRYTYPVENTKPLAALPLASE